MRTALRRLAPVVLLTALSACQAQSGSPSPGPARQVELVVQPPAGWRPVTVAGAVQAWAPAPNDALAGRARLVLTMVRVPGLRKPFQLTTAESAIDAAAGVGLQVLSRRRQAIAESDALVVESALATGRAELRLKQYLVWYGEREFVLTGEARPDAYDAALVLFDQVAAAARFGEDSTDA